MTGRSWWWWLVAGAVVAAVGSVFLVLGLESADHVSSGVGAAASVLGLVAGAAGAHRARDTTSAATPARAGPASRAEESTGKEGAGAAMDQERLTRLTAAASATLISRLAASSDWQSTAASMVALWRRARPDQAQTVAAELADTRSEVIAARARGDRQVESDLTTEWQARLRRLLAAHPAVATELRKHLPDGENQPAVAPIAMTATAMDQARICQAGRDQHITLGRDDRGGR